MVSIKILLSIILYSSVAFTKSKLPILQTKQKSSYIRYISSDGKFTYYQRRSGSLIFATNYKVHELIKGSLGTNYNIISTPNKKNIIITQDLSFHTYYGIRKYKNILINEYGTTNIKEMGKGISPSLHLNDTWISYYNPNTHLISLKSIKNKGLDFKIKISNTKNPYFIPQVFMLSNNDIILTDLNALGIPGIIHFSRNKRKSELIYKLQGPMAKLEVCHSQGSLFIGEFGINNSSRGSTIYKADDNIKSLKNMKEIYSSKHNDVGNIICNISKESIFFIKKIDKKKDKKFYEAAELSLKKQKVKIISDIEYASSIISMDGKLLLPYRGDFYILLGENNLTKLDLLENKEGDEN